jgi:hypothetical protein
MPKNSDTTDDEKFKKVVGHFLNTPPKPHKDMKKGTAKKIVHASDCAVHNAPAYEPGHCDCGAAKAER